MADRLMAAARKPKPPTGGTSKKSGKAPSGVDAKGNLVKRYATEPKSKVGGKGPMNRRAYPRMEDAYGSRASKGFSASVARNKKKK